MKRVEKKKKIVNDTPSVLNNTVPVSSVVPFMSWTEYFGYKIVPSVVSFVTVTVLVIFLIIMLMTSSPGIKGAL